MKHLFCFGLGYSARELARRLPAKGWRITGTATTADGVRAIQARGFLGLAFDGTAPGAGIGQSLSTATHVLVSIPPGPSGDPVLLQHADDLAAASTLEWIGYLSTIGVYGDRQGGWVDEDTEPAPNSDRSRRRLAAEQAWQAFAARHGNKLQIFRLAGIYGPGRGAIDNVRDGSARRILKPGQVFNRIHVADIARVLEAAIEGRGTRAIYNLTDDEPAAPDEVIAYAAELLGVLPPPAIPFESADLTTMGRSFYQENKRVGNARLAADLGVELEFPSYREGLAAIARSKS